MQSKLASGIAAVLLATGIALPLASQEITVTPKSRNAQAFVADVSHALDRELDRIYISPRQNVRGIAQVRFQIDKEGYPVNASLFHRSGGGDVGRIALKAVRGLGDVGQLPSGLPTDQIVQANIIFADSTHDLARLKTQLARIEATRMQQVVHSNSRPVLALTISASSRF
ncbi:MAG: energy transducer TonB [Porphyrobacter sp.]|nr:energy transducer TonB [Porphyrobacter sp.]